MLERLQGQRLRCSVKKYKFGVDNLNYLGYKVTHANNEIQEKHVWVQGFTTPKNKKDVQKFLGTVNWLREYVSDQANR